MIVLGNFAFDPERLVTVGVKFGKGEDGKLYGQMVIGLSAGDAIKETTFTSKPMEIIDSYVKVLSAIKTAEAFDVINAKESLLHDIHDLESQGE